MLTPGQKNHPGRTGQTAAAGWPALPPGLWRQVAEGRPDPSVLRLLRAARASRNLLLLRALHQRRRGAAAWDAIVAVLADVRRHDQEAFSAWAADPATGARLAHAVREGDGGVAEAAAAAAHRARRPFRLSVGVRNGTVALPGLGWAELAGDPAEACVERVPGGGTVVCAGSVRVRVPDRLGSPAPRWEPLPRLFLRAHGRRLSVRLETADPLRLGAPALPPAPCGAAAREGWRRRLGEAWRILAARHPAQAAAVAGTVTALVPLHAESAAGSRHRDWLSASFADAPGLLALAPLAAPASLAAALVHETQHSTLYALADCATLLDAEPGSRVPAPWSAEPRPPHALLQGAAAFLVTALFWHGESLHGNSGAREEFERWRRTAREAVATLAGSPWPTADGRRLINAMADVLSSWE
ncbi:HEXXH motif-containing putative peptide modification protein [Streptomyces sp. DSM 44917]|uniref:HEXXH motif-containing putative peptide modification protein n=1 Tax=Streptomyces boetiae TaxID=3075541 RepID=A0ABU2LH07_9ACTN|nr:HEXXH motif-containing putative peptide modification protein [Streptomyces sp. DSM 44917]MDT0310528.1 HEXXH motif-containing putative peptide modification protein [Streptomyces sp. DSM 44917]